MHITQTIMSACILYRVKRRGLRIALNIHAASGEYNNSVSIDEDITDFDL